MVEEYKGKSLVCIHPSDWEFQFTFWLPQYSRLRALIEDGYEEGEYVKSVGCVQDKDLVFEFNHTMDELYVPALEAAFNPRKTRSY
jgi:hypothetical protein